MARFQSDYPVFSVTADLVVLTVLDDRLHVLLVRRGIEPFAGAWALPGGFIREREGLEAAAYRELQEETGLSRGDVALEQLGSYGEPDRDPRGRVVTVAWVVLATVASRVTAGSDAAEAAWLAVDDIIAGGEGELAFDHRQILLDGLERARAKIEYTGLAAAFCPAEFTVGELRRVYEVVWGGGPLDPGNFQRKVLGIDGFLRPTGEVRRDGRGRPSRTYTADRSAHLHPPLVRP